MASRRFVQCDVFTTTPTRGNALAVVVDAEGISDADMQRFAAWTNLAETTFLLPPTDSAADYRVRIFTTTREMLFAGHPTLGSCATWLHCGGKPRDPAVVRQECPIGIVDIRQDLERPAFVAPPTRIEPMSAAELDELIDALGIDSAAVINGAKLNNGPQWQALELVSAQHVLNVDSSRVRWPNQQSIGLIGAHEHGAACDYEVRMLAPSSGMTEDPITGSLNSALAYWLDEQNRLQHPLTIAQGTVIERLGRVYISRSGGDILIGGDTHIVIEGSVQL